MKEAVTKVIDTLKQEDFLGGSRTCRNGTSALQPEEITSKGTRVSGVYYQQKSGNLCTSYVNPGLA